MTIMGITISAAILWLIAAAVFALIEALTLGLTTIWFAGGAVGAAGAALVGFAIIPQIAVFLVISIVLLVATRPLVKKRLNSRTEKTNIDDVIGGDGIVEETVTPYSNGQVRTDGKVWSATCTHDEIAKGAVVIIRNIKGVTLVVEEKK